MQIGEKLLFEYDQNKSQTNLNKHGIDFEDAQALWEKRTVMIPAKNIDGEKRYLVLGLIDGKHWSAVITYRGDVIRIISVRRSRNEEVDFYEEN